MRLESTKALISKIQSTDSQSAAKSINGGPHRGTYVCKELVYAYAMWISPAFMLKVSRCTLSGQCLGCPFSAMRVWP